MSAVLWFCLGACVGLLFIAWATKKEMRDIRKSKDEVMNLAKKELDELEHELNVKQNIIDSLSSKVMRQDKTIKKLNRIIEKK